MKKISFAKMTVGFILTSFAIIVIIAVLMFVGIYMISVAKNPFAYQISLFPFTLALAVTIVSVIFAYWEITE